MSQYFMQFFLKFMDVLIRIETHEKIIHEPFRLFLFPQCAR